MTEIKYGKSYMTCYMGSHSSSPSTIGLWMVQHDLIDARTRRGANRTHAEILVEVVVVVKDIDEDTLSVSTSEMSEKPL
jgi:hypothetical protein